MEVKEIIELMKAMSENGMTGFELEEGDWKLSMKREKKIVAAAQTPVVMQVPGQGSMIQTADVTAMEQVSGENAEKKISGISEKVITCPLVGTFYSAPAPDAEDYVKVGDTVKKGQVIGIVEAMKLMNEIESEYDGIVEEILVKNEETVEYGQPLFRIRDLIKITVWRPAHCRAGCERLDRG